MMTNAKDNEQLKACSNTDKEIWREREDDYYADSIHVTKENGIGINCDGYVIVMPARSWHELAKQSRPAVQADGDELESLCIRWGKYLVSELNHLEKQSKQEQHITCRLYMMKFAKALAALPPIEARPQGDVVERVARAIYVALVGKDMPEGVAQLINRGNYDNIAKAAISAMPKQDDNLRLREALKKIANFQPLSPLGRIPYSEIANIARQALSTNKEAKDE